ncbi:MAG: hypothetical protein RLZZ387_5065 [Chloroflexota bacterium]|jgi:hypothetical protein
MSTKTENILLTLAYLLFADKHHLHRLHFVGESLDRAEDWITRAHEDGLIEELTWALSEEYRDEVTGAKKKQTVRQASMWQLSKEGHDTIKHLPTYPYQAYRKRATSLLEHDRRVLDMVVRLIELARQSGLCGIKVFREVKLNPNPKSRRPVLDALMIFEVGGTFSQEHPNLVPWSLDKALSDETLWRVAIEGDNHSEPAQVVAAKTKSYKTVLANEHWRKYWNERYGSVEPVVAWGAPSEARARAIVGWWQEHWPDGRWLATSDAGLQENRWWLRWNGETAENHRLGFPSRQVQEQRQEQAQARRQDAEDRLWAQAPDGDAEIYRDLFRLTYAQYVVQKREDEERKRKQQAEAEAEQRKREEAKRAAAEAEQQKGLAAERVRQEAEERAERERQEAAERAEQERLERRSQFRRRLVRPWWWLYWLGQAAVWLFVIVAGVCFAVLQKWWEVLWDKHYGDSGGQVLLRVLTGAAVVGAIWWAGIPPWRPFVWVYEVAFQDEFGPAPVAARPSAPRPTAVTCGLVRTTADLPLRREPRLSAPMVLAEKMPRGAVALSLCSTQTSVERLAAGERTITWVHLQAQGQTGWANEEYLERER